MAKQPPPETGAVGLSFQAFIAIFPVIVIAVALWTITFSVLSPYELSELVQTVINSAITALVAFSAHNYVVTSGERRSFRALQTDHPGAFISFFALSFSVIFATMGMEWVFSNVIGHLISTANPNELRLSDGTIVALSFGLSAILMITGLVLFGGFGTILPAIVDGGDYSLAAAWNRQVKAAIIMRLFGALLLMVFLVTLEIFVLFPLLGGPSDIVRSTERQLVVETANLLLSFYFTTLVATILSKAYRGSYDLNLNGS